MFLIDSVLLTAGLLILLGVMSSKVAARLGLPVLVLFVFIGMLAGSDGLGGISFDQYQLAHAVASVALLVILFDGGYQTSMPAVRQVWKPAGLMATVGVLLTALLTAVAAMWLLDFDWKMAFLLGSIISSTDAAAVFAVLRGQGVRLEKRLSSTLEIESGANDPMAIFLTVLSIELILGEVEPGIGMLMLFFQQMGLGFIFGLAGGWAGARFINKIRLGSAALYPVGVIALSMAIYGVTVWAGGSGFWAVYIAGIGMGNSRLVFSNGVGLFLDASAWTSQIVMFTVLGLLSYPTRVWEVAWEGVLIALVLSFIVRPLVVFVSLPFFGFNVRELTMLSWVGLKGAVPIILATFPLMYEIEGGLELFDIIFFVVLFSAIVQGWSLPVVARWLKLKQEDIPEPRIHLELVSLEHVDSDIVEYRIGRNCPALGQRLRRLPLPEEVHIALLARDMQVVPIKHHTRFQQDDYVFVIHPRNCRRLLDRLFTDATPEEQPWPSDRDVVFDGHVTREDLQAFYGETPPIEYGQKLMDALGDQQERILDDWVLTQVIDDESELPLVGVRRAEG